MGPLSRKNRIKELWAHPLARDYLVQFLRQSGRNELWPEMPIAAGLRISTLDKLAGPAFVDMLLEAANVEYTPPPAPAEGEGVKWWKHAVGYQVFLPSFMDGDHDGVGDAGGLIQRLPYLEALGVDLLWLSQPFEPGGESLRSYDYTRVPDSFEELDAFDTLIHAAHERGMRVVLCVDIVATGHDHPWFRQGLAGNEDMQELYCFVGGSCDERPNNWRHPVQDNVWRWYPEVGRWGLRLTGRRRMDLNWDNAAVRDNIRDVLDFWLQRGADGFCFGNVNLLSKTSFEDGRGLAAPSGACGVEKFTHGPKLHAYLRQLQSEVRAKNPDALLAGTVHGIGTEMAKQFTAPAREELDMVLDIVDLPPDLPGPLPLFVLKKYYFRWMEHYKEYWMPLALESWDTPRILSRVGVSAVYRTPLAKLLAMMQLTLRGTPLLYQGAELGLANTRFTTPGELRDEAGLSLYNRLRTKLGEKQALELVGHVTADNARTPMPWSAGAGGGFSGAQPWMRLPDGIEHLNAALQMGDKNSVFQFYQRLIRLRKHSEGLVLGSVNPVFAKNKRVMCYFRMLDGEKWYVEMNLTQNEVPRPGRIQYTQKLELSNYDIPSKRLRPFEANLYRCE